METARFLAQTQPEALNLLDRKGLTPLDVATGRILPAFLSLGTAKPSLI